MIKKIIKNIIPWMDESRKIYKLYKKSNKYIKKNMIFIASYYRYKITKKYSCILSPYSVIEIGLKLPHPIGIVIGEGVKIGKNVTIYQNVTIGRKDTDIAKYPSIGDNVVIYSGAKILGSIVIGNNSVIGANSVVLNDVPENSVVAGIPAKIINKKKDINE